MNKEEPDYLLGRRMQTRNFVGIYLIVALFALLAIAAFVYLMHLSSLVLKTVLDVGIAGGIGGVLYAIEHGFINHWLEFEEGPPSSAKYPSSAILWYFFQPITGFIAGGVAYLLIAGGLWAVGTPTQIDYSKSILLFCGIGFLAGFAFRKFNAKLDDLTDTLFAVTPRVAPAVTTSISTVASLVVSGFPPTIAAGTSGTVTVTAKDDKDNTVTGYTGKVTITTTDSEATVTPTDYTFQASDKGCQTFTVSFKATGPQKIIGIDLSNKLVGYQDGITVTASSFSLI